MVGETRVIDIDQNTQCDVELNDLSSTLHEAVLQDISDAEYQMNKENKKLGIAIVVSITSVLLIIGSIFLLTTVPKIYTFSGNGIFETIYTEPWDASCGFGVRTNANSTCVCSNYHALNSIGTCTIEKKSWKTAMSFQLLLGMFGAGYAFVGDWPMFTVMFSINLSGLFFLVFASVMYRNRFAFRILGTFSIMLPLMNFFIWIHLTAVLINNSNSNGKADYYYYIDLLY